MQPLKIKFSFATATVLMVILFLGVGLVWAAPLIAGDIYLPLVIKNYPTATFTVTPTLTPTPTPTRTPTPTVPPPTNPIINPGFEQQDYGWTIYSNQGDPVIVAPFAHKGSFSAALGNGRDNRTASISQQIYVPILYNQLLYYRYVQSTEICGSRYDRVNIYINGSKIKTIDVCRDISSTSWKSSTINLSAYSGDTVVFRMEYDGDGNTPSYFYVDDFSFSE